MQGWKSVHEWSKTLYQKVQWCNAKSRSVIRERVIKSYMQITEWPGYAKERLSDAKGQGTTEYAILVGVLVVIAIIAVVAFRDKLQALWESITSGINSL